MAELGRLTAVFDADTARLDAAFRHTHRNVQTLTSNTHVWARALGQAVNSAAPQISQLANSFNQVTAGAGALTSAVGVAAFTVTAFTVVAAGAAKGIYELATNAAATADRIGDLADKVNFSVRTLSGLSPAIEASGGSLEGFNNALGIFDRNIEKVAQGDERLSKLFKGLKIDATDNEVAFRQVAEVLVKLGGTSQQTALAMELFGRSGKDVLGVIKAADGNVEEFIKRMEALGIVIGDDAVKAADAFDRQMVLVTAQVNTVIRQLGEEFIPLVSEAASNLSGWMKDNQGEIRKTIVEVANLVKAIAGLAQYIRLVSPIILVVETVNMFRNLLPSGGSAQGITNQQARNVFTQDPVTGRRIYSGNRPFEDTGEFAIAGGAGSRSAGAGPGVGPRDKTETERLQDLIRQLLARGSGGGRGGGGSKADPLADMKKLADLQVRITLEALQREEEDIERSYDQRRLTVQVYHRAISRLQDVHHQTVLDALKSEENAIQSSKKLTDTEKKIALQELELKRMEEANRHRREANRLDDTILQITRERVVSMERLVSLQTRPRRAEEDIGALTRPRRAEEDIGGITRPRIATDLERARRDQYREHLERMRDLAHNLTGLIDRAVYDGWKGGLLGALDILRNVFMRQLEDMLTNMLSNISGGGGGGSWASKFLSIAAPALISGFGGGGISSGGLGSGIAGAIGRDKGGPIWPNQAFRVHKDETIVPTAPGFVIPKNGLGQTVINNHYSIQFPPLPNISRNPKASGRQQAEAFLAAIRGAQS